MQKLILCALCAFCFSTYIYAQNSDPPFVEMDRCGTTENDERLKALYPEYRINRDNIERFIRENQHLREVIDGITTIPVVFHVIHDGDAIGSNENLPESLILAQLDQLNDDFRRMNSDAGNTPADFTGIAADVEVEFCLAQVDPSGAPTTGINRINISSLPGVDLADCWDDDYIDANIKIPTFWNSANYLNIWTVVKIQRSSNCANTILGYAQFPGGPANTDGVVLRATTVGSIANPNPNGGDYALGRTGTHEIGHYLNLIHIWGDGDCTVDDEVADTPLAGGDNTTGSPCTYPGPNSCDEGAGDLPDMFMNYMDYSDDECMNMFSNGQKTRMLLTLLFARLDLVNAPCAPDCTEDLVLSGTLEGSYLAGNTISTSGATTVPSANDVILEAPGTVTLGNGFSTIGNAGLYIGFGDCSPSPFTAPDSNLTTGAEAQMPEVLERMQHENRNSGRDMKMWFLQETLRQTKDQVERPSMETIRTRRNFQNQ